MNSIISSIQKVLTLGSGSKKAQQYLLVAKRAGREISFTGENFTKSISKQNALPLLHQAVALNNLAVVEFIFSLLKDNKIDLEEAAEGYTPLQTAVLLGYYLMAQYLIEKGAKVQSVFERHYSAVDCSDIIVPFHSVIENNDVEMFTLIMDSIACDTDTIGIALYLLNNSSSLEMIAAFVESEYVSQRSQKQEKRELVELTFKLDKYEAFEIIVHEFDTEELNCVECESKTDDCPHQESSLRHFLTFTGYHSIERRERYYSTAFPSDDMPVFEHFRPIFYPSSPDPYIP